MKNLCICNFCCNFAAHLYAEGKSEWKFNRKEREIKTKKREKNG